MEKLPSFDPFKQDPYLALLFFLNIIWFEDIDICVQL